MEAAKDLASRMGRIPKNTNQPAPKSLWWQQMATTCNEIELYWNLLKLRHSPLLGGIAALDSSDVVPLGAFSTHRRQRSLNARMPQSKA